MSWGGWFRKSVYLFRFFSQNDSDTIITFALLRDTVRKCWGCFKTMVMTVCVANCKICSIAKRCPRCCDLTLLLCNMSLKYTFAIGWVMYALHHQHDYKILQLKHRHKENRIAGPRRWSQPIYPGDLWSLSIDRNPKGAHKPKSVLGGKRYKIKNDNDGST